ncbi:TetR/AcrR family transcriptional regulator [Arthrobacter sp. ISL-65]|uniref:TetR/AcrR family transcriptional regulator n=1 Tax=Arthrobacter sp. ISL-65 TaxID=2819112 RepID=UPI001BEC2171|nr:TetR/AcrR family transcriptional regulator [Arthrobacter sp. ISL-65]MBT2550254.1 TetR/AcrR family transcriptional regulator [Arthrobacter sp. ISL-65]
MGKEQAVQEAAGWLSRSAAGQDKSELQRPADRGREGAAAGGVQSAAPRRRTQQERREEAETRLLAAALTLLSRKGWVGMTLAEVGQAAGYSRGQAAHHFGSKGALLRALTLHINRSFAQEMQAAPTPPAGLQAVLGYVRVYLGRSDPKWTNTRTLLLLLAESLLENSETAGVVAEYNREMFAWLEDNLRVGIARGEVRGDIDPALGAEFVVGAMRGLALQRLLQGQVADIRGIRDQVVQLVEHTFAAPTDREQEEGANDGR